MWDQNDGGVGPPPEGFFYGSEYTKEDIDRALNSETPYSVIPSRDEKFHGTIMAGLAAGSEIEENGFVGAAPEAQMIVVKLKPCKEYLREYYRISPQAVAYQETDIMLGIKYAVSFSRAFSRPLVICLGVGTNLGDHSGNSFLAAYMNQQASKKNCAVVSGVGNEANRGHHYRGRLVQGNQDDVFQDVEVRVASQNRGFYMELWGNRTDVLTVSIRTPGGEVVPALRISEQQTQEYSFVFERTTLIVQNVFLEALSGEQLIRFFFTDPTEGIWTFRVSAATEVHNGRFDMWLPLDEFLYSAVTFLEPDPDITAVEPGFQNGVIVAGAYQAENESIWLESGRGFGREGEITPTLTAPGVNVSTIYGQRTGSSLAAAITAGGAAQLMQWAVVERRNPLLDGGQLKNYLIKGAVRMPGTDYPNVQWGYGKLNVRGVLESMRAQQ